MKATMLILGMLLGMSSVAGADNCDGKNVGQLDMPMKAIQAGGQVTLGEGRYFHNGEVTITKPVVLRGAGAKKTRIVVCVTGHEAALHVLSNNVTIQDLTVEVIVVGRMGNGGTGAFGTGITLGNYFDSAPFEDVKNIKIKDIVIHRGRLSAEDASMTANAFTIVGRVSHVEIENVTLLGKHSSALMMHWGGQFVKDCRVKSFRDEFISVGGQLYCAIKVTHHPHDIVVRNFKSINRTGALVTLASVYNILVEQVTGRAPFVVNLLPGDEGSDLASREDRDLIGSNLTVRDVDATLPSGTLLSAPISISGKGGSKWDRSLHQIRFNNVMVENIRLRAEEGAEADFRVKRRGVYAVNTQGAKIYFKNIDLGELGRDGYSFALSTKLSSGIRFNGIKTEAQNGLLLKNSEDIMLVNSSLARTTAVVSPTLPNGKSRGVLIRDDRENRKASDEIFLARNVKISGYDIGMATQKNIPSICSRIELQAPIVIDSLQSDYIGAICTGWN